MLNHICVFSQSDDFKAMDGSDYLEHTILLLQHVVSSKRGILMKVGGADGDRLARAAFSVIIKFSEQADMFRNLWDSVELHGLEIDGDKTSPQNLDKLAKSVRKDRKDDFATLCFQWEQASKIRKWTQELKKDLTE